MIKQQADAFNAKQDTILIMKAFRQLICSYL